MTTKTLPTRAQVPVEMTWNLNSIFWNIEEWESVRKDVETDLPKLKEYQGRLGESPEVLLEYLSFAEKITILALKVMVFSGLDQSTDVTDQDISARAAQGRRLMTELRTVRSFEVPELMSIDSQIIKKWMEVSPELRVYKHYFHDLERQSPHIRSQEVEEILAMTSEPLPPSTPPAYTYLINSELPFQPATSSDGTKIELGQSSINSILTNEDLEVRQSGFENYTDAYLKFRNTISGIQTQAIQRDVFNAKARNYRTSLEASLLPNNIPTEVFYNLIDVFKSNLPIWHKYWRVRREALGYPALSVYDIKAPLTDKKIEIPFEQAVEWICKGMEPLGEEYVSILRKGCLEDRWIDRALNRGKRQGAFSWGSYGTQPFIMMSYADDVFSMSTLAHELGHSMHSFYTNKYQPLIYAHYSLFVAEVASNFNQAMVRDYLFKNQQDPTFQLALIEETMSNFHRYFFIMPTLAQWELAVHERIEKGGPTNAKIFTDLCSELFMEGYGNQVEYDHDQIGITWAQFGHMYMNFYVYQYATGISGAHALVDQVIQGGKQAAEQYLDFLKTGNAEYPLDALKKAGVDLTKPEPVEKAFQVLAGIVDRLEGLVSEGYFKNKTK